MNNKFIGTGVALVTPFNDDLSVDHQQWLKGADFTEGSWWPRWEKWLKKRSGTMIPARTPGDDGRKILGDAPGEYVAKKANR